MSTCSHLSYIYNAIYYLIYFNMWILQMSFCEKFVTPDRVLVQQTGRAGNSLIGFMSESLVFYKKMSKWAICSKKWEICSFAHFWWVTWMIPSCSLIFGERPERIAHGCSFLVSDLSDLLTSLIFGELPRRFAYNAHQNGGNERIAHFLNKKNVFKTH